MQPEAYLFQHPCYISNALPSIVRFAIEFRIAGWLLSLLCLTSLFFLLVFAFVRRWVCDHLSCLLLPGCCVFTLFVQY